MASMEPTPKILCHGKNEAKKLEEILNRIKNGAEIKSVIQIGSIVYVHFEE